METTSQNLDRIAVLRALYLGDMLCCIPAIRALRHANPAAQITLVGLPWAKAFAQRFSHYFDEFRVFPGFPGLPEQPLDCGKTIEFFRDMQSMRCDLALQMHGSGAHVNEATLLLGAKQTAGFYQCGEFCPNADSFLAYPATETEVWRHLRLMQHLGIPLQGDHLEFPLDETDHERLHAVPDARQLRRNEYVCLHVGAKFPSRRWPATKFAATARQLAREGFQIVFTGVLSELHLVDEVISELDVPRVNLAGQTDLGSLGALLDGACLVVTNDTGVSHMAAALRVPSVIIVLGSDFRRWAPQDRTRHRILRVAVECHPCEHEVCPIGFGCAEGIAAEDVLRTARELIHNFPQGNRDSAPSSIDSMQLPDGIHGLKELPCES